MSTYTASAPARERPAAPPKTAYLDRERRPARVREHRRLADPGGRWRRMSRPPSAELGWSVVRANDVDPETGHGFISSQRMGLEVFKGIPSDAPLIVAEAVWQYSHHVLAGLRTHRGPDPHGRELRGRLARARRPAGTQRRHDEDGQGRTPRSGRVDFTDDWFKDGPQGVDRDRPITHDASHVRPLPDLPDTPGGASSGAALADQLLADKAIIGVFDEGCMGMYNAIFDDELLNPLGIYKERLSQSALYAEMLTVTDAEADAVGDVADRSRA